MGRRGTACARPWEGRRHEADGVGRCRREYVISRVGVGHTFILRVCNAVNSFTELVDRIAVGHFGGGVHLLIKVC